MQKITIPENEYDLFFSRSSSKGGQNVDKVATKVTLKWNVNDSTFLDEGQKKIILKRLDSKIDKEGNLILYSQEERYQKQNREEVIEKLNNLISHALRPIKKRVPTKPTRSSNERRIKEKKEKAHKKKLRKVNEDLF